MERLGFYLIRFPRTKKGVLRMYLAPAPLAPAATELRSGALPLDQFINDTCAWLESADMEVHALLPEPDRRRRLLRDAWALEARYPHPAARPPPYVGVVGGKGVVHDDLCGNL